MDENASEREQEWDVKLSRGGYVLNEPHSEMTTVVQSALDTVNQMGGFKFAGVSAIFESIAVESFALDQLPPAPSCFVMIDWSRDWP